MRLWVTQCAIAGTLLMGVMSFAAHAETDLTPDMDTSGTGSSLAEITVTAARIELIGKASTASEGLVADQEIQLAPTYRPGQLLETVPGLIVTLHSGEGKANQFLLRGYNLDHGTDLQTDVDDMPINQPTHADEINYTKGPYYANVGDFGAVGSVRMSYRDTIEDQVSATLGTLGFQHILAAGSQTLGIGTLLAGVEMQHYDGPFVTPDDARKENLVMRYSGGDAQSGYSATAMYYHQIWTNTTDIPIRAITEDLVPNRFGTLDPTDGGQAQRASPSLEYHANLGNGVLSTSGFFIYNQLHLFNDFTHFLFDPVHGDQEDQFENRRVTGGAASYALPMLIGSIQNEITAGVLTRYDLLGVGRLPSEDQQPMISGNDPASFYNHDQVYLFAGGAYVQAVTRWTPYFRSVLGLRDDYQHGTDIDYLAELHEAAGYTNGGTAQQSLLQPKGSLIFTPTDSLEFYLSIGRGFHSADLRGVNQDESVDLGLPHSNLLSKQEGQEIGV